jgi:GDP-4-dehydro-6-deoxy-D-mannose reductase
MNQAMTNSETILVTGTAGMIGSHLFEALAEAGNLVVGTYFRPTVPLHEIAGADQLIELDVRYFEPVRRLLAEHRPAIIFHLAAQSLPTLSWERPWETIDTNVLGTINLFEAVKAAKSGNAAYDPIIVVACSSAQYGASMTPENVPIHEEAPMLPLHPYGVSKVAQDLLAFQYWRSDGLRGIRARIFNTTGPRKRDDVVSDFARRVVRIRHRGGTLRVGNIETRRAILDVRDTVAALIALAEKGVPGEAYNICADHAYPIGELVHVLERLTNLSLVCEPDPLLMRPTDEAVIFGSNVKLSAATGWRQTTSLDQTVAAVLDYEQRRFGAEASSGSD